MKKTRLGAWLKIVVGSLFQLTALFTFLIAIAASSALGQQLVQNGDFESGGFSDWIQSGNTNSTLIATNSSYAHSGIYGAQLGPVSSLGFISQTLSTTPGQTNFLSLWLDSPDGRVTNEFQVFWNGTNIFDQVNIGAIGWTNLQFAVVSTGANTVLQFGFRDDPSYLGLDDISVTNVAGAPIPIAYTFTTLAGYPGYGSADGVGGAAEFFNPFGVTVDNGGNVYIADGANNTIRKITSAGVVSTIAGFAGTSGSADGTGSNARFSAPRGLAVDGAGNLYVADLGNHTIRKLTPSGTNWTVSTIAGLAGISGTNDGTGSLARFYRPTGIAVDTASNLYVADYNNYTIRKIAPVGTNWVVSTIAGLAGSENTNDGTGSLARFEGPSGIAVDGADNLYVADSLDEAIRKITPVGNNWMVSTFVGSARFSGSTDATGAAARFNFPAAVVLDGAGNLYVADGNNNAVRKVTSAGVVTTIAGLPSALSGNADGTGGGARFYEPQGIGMSSSGILYVADTDNNEIRKVTTAGVVSTIAGAAAEGNANGAGSVARFNYPYGIAVDGAGNLYVSDQNNDTIRQVTSAGVVSDMAGSVTNSGSADGAGSTAQFDEPHGVAVDNNGNVYVADFVNFTIRKITPAGVVSTIAGLAGNTGSTDGTNNGARFNFPDDVAVDSAGNLYVADTHNETIRKLKPMAGTTNWVVTTIAGLPGSSGTTDGPNNLARFNAPVAVAVDNNTNLYVVDQVSFASLIRKVTPVGTNWVVSTIAGAPVTLGGSADGIGTNAQFSTCDGIAVDSADNLYVTDSNNHTIRKLTQFGASWAVSTIGGLVGSVGNVDGTGNATRFGIPNGITVDTNGNVYVADGGGTIRKGGFTAFTAINAVPYTPPIMTGKLMVTLPPPEAGGQWRFPWEQTWHNSGEVVSNLAKDNYTVEFRSVPGFLALPLAGTVSVTNGMTTYITNQCYPTATTVDTNSGGSLMVTLGPNPPGGAGWRFLGDTTPFYLSGYSTNLIAGTYLIEFAPVGGYSKPPNLSVQVLPGLPTILSENYLLADSPPSGVELPFPVPAANISDLADYPFGFNGQLQSDVGYGSGVAVLPKVVLTAAHIVFNDQTLNYVSQTYWYFQQETNVFATQPPQVALGWLVLSGYASQRTNDLDGLGGQTYGPDESSPQSRNLDVAALYFASPVAGGGYGGYLPSDASPNPWLTGNSLKMLVGYPVDGSLFGDASIMPGVIYQTQPQPYALNPDTEPEVYTAPWFLSYPGNSGGPVYVQLNGYYYPAGVYLGTINNGTYESAVRAIDSYVVNLITNAETLADYGTNNTGGGVITVVPSQAVSASNPGYLQFQLGPPAAVAAGAGWRLVGDSTYSSATNYIRAVFSTNAFAVEFKPIAGWNVPTSQSVTVQPGNIASYTALYTVNNPVPVQIVSPQVSGGSFNLSFQSANGQSYTLYYNDNLATTNWLPATNVTGNGATLQLSIPSTNSAQRFFRISQP
ncbi:MAG TPA: hypothetical protein VGH42_03000 [Verrucomicrobiae bacterium]